MKLLKKLLCGAAVLAGVSNVSAQAEMFMFPSDSAYVTVTRSNPYGQPESFSVSSPHPEIIEYVDGTLSCNTFSLTHCSFKLSLKLNGPVDFNGISTSFATYGYAEIVSPRDAAIDLNLWANNNLKISEVMTQPSPTLTSLGEFVPTSQGDVQSLFDSSNENEIIIDVRNMRIDPILRGLSTQHQSLFMIASGIRDTDLNVWKDGEALGEGYIVAEGNKGVSSVVEAGDVAAFLTDYWNQSGGHYSALNFFTNGTDRFQPGLDLSEYTTINFEMGCKKGVTVEAFFGRDSDSSQNFLTDIVCDDFTKTYTFDISGFNKSDIQTALWFHIPTWKNAGFNDFRIWMNTFEVTLSK